ncbi:aldehyde dehydrogenase family protein [Pleionea sp. CnH1-48]|uniref:aldehyde dehydrogenase family protein n=1 Tax=Pleionea sp. CnH1-48 TaxID=2954494 RepID=UPI0020977D26|nr:aldehyde dehydrogenase family protein [Pleionea sp. CnH1-48]MCO7225726.1 aldehyde dehydrogenase family protein [Pleionea sp. CnH1-48]
MSPRLQLDVLNPSTGDIIETLCADSLESATQKLATAHKTYQDASQRLPVHQRIAWLTQIAEQLAEQQESFAQTIATEGGKPLKDARVEAARAVAGIHTAIHYLHQNDGTQYPLTDTQSQAPRRAMSSAFPIGPVLAFSAFNHPLNLIVHQVIPALAAGCPCVIKPAPDTPLSCLNFVKLMWQVGVPKHYIDVVITADLNIAQALIDNLTEGFFSFIGSAKVGWQLRAKLNPGVRCALEHGGIAPSVVTESADLKRAIPDIVKGAFYHAGQVCVSTQRLYVHSSRQQEVLQQLVEATQQLHICDARDPKTDVGPLIRSKEVTRLTEWIEEAKNNQCEVVLGGKAINAHFFEPTILLNPDKNLKVSQAEVFGPVLCIYTYEHLEEAIQQANDTPFAFQASVYSHNIQQIEQCYQQLNAAAVMVNEHTAFRDDAMPFAGLKHSGLGIGGIPYTIDDMQFQKMQIWKHTQ